MLGLVASLLVFMSLGFLYQLNLLLLLLLLIHSAACQLCLFGTTVGPL